MKKNVYTYLSNIALVIGGLLGAYVLIDFFVRKSRLPAGACPLTDNRSIIIVAVIFLALAFVFSILETRQKKKTAARQKGQPDDPEKPAVTTGDKTAEAPGTRDDNEQDDPIGQDDESDEPDNK